MKSYHPSPDQRIETLPHVSLFPLFFSWASLDTLFTLFKENPLLPGTVGHPLRYRRSVYEYMKHPFKPTNPKEGDSFVSLQMIFGPGGE